jgi:hypothetical protein
VDHDVLDALVARQLDQRLQVPHARVHAAGGDEPEEV